MAGSGPSTEEDDLPIPLMREMRNAFKIFDQHGTGSINRAELGDVLNKLDHHPSEKQLSDVMKMVGQADDGLISFGQFLRIYKGVTPSLSRANSDPEDNEKDNQLDEEELAEAFRKIMIKFRTPTSSRNNSRASSRVTSREVSRTNSPVGGEMDEDEILKEEHLAKVFQELDLKGDGFIDRDELTEGLKKKGEIMSQFEIEEAMRFADLDGDGLISYEEFTALCNEGRTSHVQTTS